MQTCAASHKVKSSQSHDFDFFEKNEKSHDFDFDLTFRLFSFFEVFFVILIQKRALNSPKVCQMCKLLIK
jgi:hypothetical protein